MSRVALSAISLTLDGEPERSSTTVGAVGAYAVVVATALPQRGVTLTSCYLADMISDIAVSHLCSAPGHGAHIQQRVLPADQPGQTHARVCLLDHAAELQAALASLINAAVAIDVGPVALELAARAWTASEDPPR